MTKTNTLNTLLDEFEEYDENLHDVTPSSILHTIIKLDYYYGSRKLNGMKNRILDEDVEKKQLDMLKELIKLAEKNQDDIVQGLVDAVKEKVQHIIDNSSVYIELLEYEKKGEVIQDQMYTLMGRLEKKDLVEVTQDGD
jgi:non-homologous end joining protein Ku